MALTPRIRFQVLQRDGFTCQYCGQRPPAVRLHVDHIVPRSKGGSDRVENLQAACHICNAGKAARQIPGIEEEENEDPMRMLTLGLLYLLHAVGPLEDDPTFFCGDAPNIQRRRSIAGANTHYAWSILADFGDLPNDDNTRRMLGDLTGVLGEWWRDA